MIKSNAVIQRDATSLHPLYEASRRRRCLVPVDNFYEWQKTAAGKQPYAIVLKGGGLMALAGLWENWRSLAGRTRAQFRHHHHGAQ
jgi:putative SOS response-associated peptidase YedK